MPISLTCTCGARLEIDDKFAGQKIPCPDCNKPLVAEPAPPPPPEPTTTSGLAVLSLLLALIGAFTVVGTLAAIACGAAAYRRVTRRGSTVGGARLAQAGMILGAVFTVISVGVYASRSLVGLDGVLRQYVWASKLEFLEQATLSKRPGAFDESFLLDRPSRAWGVLKPQPSQKEQDLLMLVNPREDAHILWLWDNVDGDDDAASMRARAVTVFRASDFVKLLGRVPDLESESYKQRDINDGQGTYEFYLDITLGGIPRTFLFRLQRLPGRPYVNVLVAGARAHRFEQLLPMLRRATSIKQEVP